MAGKSSNGSKLLVNDKGTWQFGRGKYVGRSVNEVAGSDKKYLRWLFDKAGTSLTDDAFFFLSEFLDKSK